MLLMSMLRFLPIGEERLLSEFVPLIPQGARSLMISVISEAYAKSDTAVISIAAITSLWAGSIGVHSLVKGIDKIYSDTGGSNSIILRFKSIFYTLFVLFILVLCLGVFVFGDTIITVISGRVPWAGGILRFLVSLRKFIGVVLLCLFFLVMYTVVPGRKVRLMAQLPGALIGGLGWVIFSNIFSYCYENIFDFSYLYGSLSVLVFFMLWLFFCMYILFVGAEVNKYCEKSMEN